MFNSDFSSFFQFDANQPYRSINNDRLGLTNERANDCRYYLNSVLSYYESVINSLPLADKPKALQITRATRNTASNVVQDTFVVSFSYALTPEKLALVDEPQINTAWQSITITDGLKTEEGILITLSGVSSIEFYLSNINWGAIGDDPGRSNVSIINNIGIAGNDFAYPGLYRWSMVIHQPGLSNSAVNCINSSPQATQTVITNPAYSIAIAVNDVIGSYGDNVGSFTLHYRFLS